MPASPLTDTTELTASSDSDSRELRLRPRHAEDQPEQDHVAERTKAARGRSPARDPSGVRVGDPSRRRTRPGTASSSAATSAKKIARLMMLLRSVRDCAAIASAPLLARPSALLSDGALPLGRFLRILFAFPSLAASRASITLASVAAFSRRPPGGRRMAQRARTLRPWQSKRAYWSSTTSPPSRTRCRGRWRSSATRSPRRVRRTRGARAARRGALRGGHPRHLDAPHGRPGGVPAPARGRRPHAGADADRARRGRRPRRRPRRRRRRLPRQAVRAARAARARARAAAPRRRGGRQEEHARASRTCASTGAPTRRGAASGCCS